MDPWLDPRTLPVRTAQLEPLVAWIEASWLTRGSVRILDLGCGDLLLRRRLPLTCIVDGYDPSPDARMAASRTLTEAGPGSGQVWDDVASIPVGAYDGVVISSVVQYLPSDPALGAMLCEVAARLRADGAHGAVVTDVVQPGRARLGDGTDLLRFLTRRFGPTQAAMVLARTVRRSPGNLRAFSEHQVLSAAAAAGLECQLLDRNLSPLSGRATYVLRPARAGDGS